MQETAYTSEVNPFSVVPMEGGEEKDQDVVRHNSVASFGHEIHH